MRKAPTTSYDGLRNLGYVAKRIESERRRSLLPWTYHQEVAPLEPEEQDYWLDLAEENSWNRATLRQAIKESRADHPPWVKHTDVLRDLAIIAQS